MRRTWMGSVFTLVAVSVAQAHFTFVAPEADGSKVKVIFSDTLEPDLRVNIDKIAATKLTLRDASGQESPLEWKKADGYLLANVPGTGPRTVYGTTDYGVRQKGEGKPYHLFYHPKAHIGGLPAKGTPDAKVPLEIVPQGTAGKTQFQVFAAGKPMADLEVSVILPGGGKKAVKTDADGRTPTFDATGRYGVVAKHFEPKAGEYAGQKYEEIRRYATLVVDVLPGR